MAKLESLDEQVRNFMQSQFAKHRVYNAEPNEKVVEDWSEFIKEREQNLYTSYNGR